MNVLLSPAETERSAATSSSKWRIRLALLAVGSLVTFAWSAAAQAQVSLNSSFTFNMGTGLFTYSYGVTNNGTFDLALVDLSVAPDTQIADLTAPAGFIATYDAGVNLVSFLEDADFFTPQTFAPSTTVGQFTFTSPIAPGTASFSALDIVGNTSTGVTVSPVPEPTTLFWSGALAACALLKRHRRGSEVAPAV